MTQEMRTYKKGDIYYYDFGENPGSIQNGKRPALILQADNFNTKAPTIIGRHLDDLAMRLRFRITNVKSIVLYSKDYSLLIRVVHKARNGACRIDR